MFRNGFLHLHNRLIQQIYNYKLNNLLTYVYTFSRCKAKYNYYSHSIRLYSTKKTTTLPVQSKTPSNTSKISPENAEALNKLDTKIQTDKDDSIFHTDPTSVNIDEEALRYDYEEFEERQDEDSEEEVIDLPSYRTKRGANAVYDIEDLMLVLNENKALYPCVLKIPDHYDYCDYMVIVTGKSMRHLRAMAEDIRKTYKRKRSNNDPETVNIEGMLSKDWLAMDLGNIVVHLFLKDARKLYDLEQLWAVGSEFDEQSQVDQSAVESSSEYVSNFMKDFDDELRKFKILSNKKT